MPSVRFPRSYRGIFTALRTLPAVVDLSDHLTAPFIVSQARWVNNLSAEATLHQRVLVCIDLVTHQTSHTSRQVGLKTTIKQGNDFVSRRSSISAKQLV